MVKNDKKKVKKVEQNKNLPKIEMIRIMPFEMISATVSLFNSKGTAKDTFKFPSLINF